MTLVWLFFLPHWKPTEDPEAKRAVFCTIPAIRRHPANLFCEVVGTMVLIVVIAAIGSRSLAPARLAPAFSPYFVSMLVCSIGLSLGRTTGYAINPARDFGPRVTHALWPVAGKGTSDWAYAPIPILGPLLGAAIAAVLIRVAHIV